MAGVLVLALAAGCGGGSSPTPAPGELKLAATTYGAAEDAGTVTITVQRTGGSAGAASVQYATGGGTATAGTDYTAATGTLQWAAGDAANKTVIITISDDADFEADETLTFTLSNAVGATLGAPAVATVSITNDDIAAVNLSGVAATGAPIVGATITITDANGDTVESTTGTDGTFEVDIAGMQPPLLVRVDLGGGAALFSVSNADSPSVVNVHPLTDLVVRAWYEAQGTTAAAAFDDPVANPAPSPEQVAFIVDVVERVVQVWLVAAGIDPANFDLIATPFDADGSGFDGVLDDTVIDPVTGDFEIDDGTTNQVVTVTTGTTLTLSSMTTGPGGSSSSVTSTVVPVEAGATDAIAGVKAMLDDLASLVETAGDDLAAADFLPFISENALDQGRDREILAAVFASELRGLTVVSADLGTLYAIDEAGRTVHADLELELALGELSETDSFPMHFAEEDGVWKLAGDGHGVEGDAQMEHRIDMRHNGTDIYHAVNVHISAPPDTVESVAISGGVFDDTPVPDSGSISIEEIEGTPGEITEIQSEAFFLNSGALNAPLPAGTEFTIFIEYIGGDSEAITRVTGATTNEVALITSPTAHTLATANLGGELDVTWELPTTFALANIDFGAVAFTDDGAGGVGEFTCFADPEFQPGVTSTSGTLIIPATCNGEPVLHVNVGVSFNGVNGERIQVLYSMGDSP
ncbi:MAG: Calx-beta domain-containing protein [Gammaproteobacteria bacterium]